MYQQMDEVRRAALQARVEMLSATRAEAERELASASSQLQAEAEEAKRRLSADAEALGVQAAERIRGRKAS